MTPQQHACGGSDNTLKGNITGEDLTDMPAHVDGGLAGDGAWLTTPHGWRLAFGALAVAPPPAGASTFSLSAVCLPPAPSSPASPTPSPAASPSAAPPGSATASATHSPSSVRTSASPAGAGLPITGGPAATVALVGLVTVAAGILLVAVRRRRDTRFRA